ncbi:MAG TPA: hypothetical protein DEP66_04965 [Acidimicrobiaceae bacterium]|nr:hypothetical protein [Acidimicrobiaceae bacterium]HCB37549.1 hypothetical protein [Acidimicrobiaceae bacterium]
MSLNDPIVAFALLAWMAYLASRLLARHHMPELVGFLVVGALAGPSGFKLIDAGALASMRPITEVALAVLMFVIGERVSARALRAARWTLTAGVVQFVLCAVSVYWVTNWLGADRAVSLVLAALAGAGAPMTIAHLVSSARAHGSYPTGVIGTHAVADALATTTFAAVLPVAVILTDESPNVPAAVLDFIQLGIGGAALGLVGGWVISRLGAQIETSGELLLFVLVHVLVGWVIAGWFDISLPLAALVAGASAATASAEAFSVRLFRTIKTIEQPLYLLFFALAGASIHLSEVPKVGLVGLAYVVVRVVAKIVGGLGGGMLGGLGWRLSLRLGVNLTPQAGVAVGLAVLATERLGDHGAEAATVVLGSVVLFELIGPLLVAKDFRSWATSVEEDGDAPAGLAVPSRVLLAAPRSVEVPEWVVDQVAHWHAALVVLLPWDDDSDETLALAALCAGKGVEFRFEPLKNESFVGSVVRARLAHEADYVMLFSDRFGRPASRLALLPAERVLRQMPVPVAVFPIEPSEPDPRPRRFPWQTP